MKVFVCEFITGGGLYPEPLPASLLKEGVAMRDAVLEDFAQIPDIDIIQTCDARLQRPLNAEVVDVDVWAVWERCMREADAVLLIAPETGGALYKLTLMAEDLGKTVLGCASSAVALTSDKLLTYRAFQTHQIPTVATWLYADFSINTQQGLVGEWVSKPRDGAGCHDMAYFYDADDLNVWIQGRQQSHIVQPFQKGVAASFSMLCKAGQAYLLSANQQKIEIKDQQFFYHGGVVNGLMDYLPAFERVAQTIVQAIPGLAGYVGVDLIVDGADCYVIEINPRLTTSYVALHQACGVNPARMMLNLFYNEVFEMPVITHQKIDISMNNSTHLHA